MASHIKQLTSHSPEETRELGRKLGEALKPGSILFLTGDLGSGKTAFVQGLARGLDVPDTYYVTSPTYTLINEYPGRVVLYHMDLYRISDSDEVYDLGIEEMVSANGVIVVEWPDRLPAGFMKAGLSIRIDVMEDDSRNFFLTISDMDLDFQI